MVKPVTMSLAGYSPLTFFRKLGREEKSPAYIQSGEWTVIAWNPARSFVGDDPIVLQKAKKFLKNFHGGQHLPFVGGLIGWISYDAGCTEAGFRSKHLKKSRVPEYCAHGYHTALLWNGRKLLVVGDAAFRRSVRDIHRRPLSAHPLAPLAWKPCITESQYERQFEHVMQGIQNGDFYQLNLTYQFQSVSENDPRALFATLIEHNPAGAASYIEHGATAVLSASPERFITVQNGVITTCPVKGTRPRGRTPKEDSRLVSELLQSPKEQAELNMITDLLRNDIGKVSEPGSVHVKGHRLLQKNPSVWHTYSVIEGHLSPRIHPLDALLSMSPGGSVTGCPKSSALETIDTEERSRRGMYCGTAFMLSRSGRLDSSILIRTIVRDRHNLSVGVGGGIVADSNRAEEYAETLHKAGRILSIPVRRTWVNGRETVTDVRLKALNPSARGFRGCFETMRMEEGKIHARTLHLSRLHHGVRTLRLGSTVHAKRIDAYLERAACAAGGGVQRVKVVVTQGACIIETRPYADDPALGRGVRVSVTRLTRARPEVKMLPYHREWHAYMRASKEGYGETLLLNTKGEISEGSISNLFCVQKGVLITPGSDMLPGVTRRRVILLAKKLGMDVRIAPLRLSDLRRADEVFLTRSLAGIVPVLRIKAHRVGKGRAGRITRTLQKAFSGTLHST